MKKIIVNFKMNGTVEQTKSYLINLLAKADQENTEITLCLPYTSLSLGRGLLGGSKINLGAQNLADEESGSYTGEISGEMLAGAGVTHVIVGHSERRAKFKENSRIINKKIKIAFNINSIHY